MGELETGWATQRAAGAARGAVDKGIRGRRERERECERERERVRERFLGDGAETQGGGRHGKAWLALGTRKGS